MRFPFSLALILVSCLPFVGCKGDGMAHVSGTVTYDGKPIETGMISFIAQDGHTGTADQVISNGKYEVDVPPGQKIVKITATKVVRERPAYDAPNSPMIQEFEQYLPVKFNDQSTLTCEIKASGPQNFELMP